MGRSKGNKQCEITDVCFWDRIAYVEVQRAHQFHRRPGVSPKMEIQPSWLSIFSTAVSDYTEYARPVDRFRYYIDTSVINIFYVQSPLLVNIII